MTNQSNQLFGGGRRPGLRSPGVRHRVFALCLMLGLLASALPAWAAEIVEVRVGRHPTFTRVVFELDRAAGYRIERSDPSKGVAELIVSLEASSTPRSLSHRKSMIEQVDVEPMGSRSVARVRLAKDGLRLKEMILTNPPRIVLDVMLDKPPAPVVAKAPAKPKAKPEPKPEPKAKPSSPAEDEAFEAVVAKIPVEEKAPVRKPEPRPVVKPEPVPEPVVAVREVIEEGVPEEAEAFFEDDPQMAVNEPSTSMTVEMMEPTAMDTPEAVEEIAEAMPAPAPVEPTPPAKPRTPRPMVATTDSSDEDGGGWMTWALVGVGAVVLLAGGFFVARKRGGSAAESNWDDDDEDDAPISYADQDTVTTDVDENPFGDLTGGSGSGATLGGPDEATVPPMADEEDTTLVNLPDEEKESESVVFDDSEEKVMDDMEVISREQVNESLGGSMPPVGGAVPEEFQQMMMEMNRRMEALETRCDELVDARDRLERQVAAQTEELRVQRAAIARTQRAVRNLGRPEEEEQEATEPALRDPNQPKSE